MNPLGSVFETILIPDNVKSHIVKTTFTIISLAIYIADPLYELHSILTWLLVVWLLDRMITGTFFCITLLFVFNFLYSIPKCSCHHFSLLSCSLSSSLPDSLNQNFLLVISHHEAQRDYSLNFPGSRTIQEVKWNQGTRADTHPRLHAVVHMGSVGSFKYAPLHAWTLAYVIFWCSGFPSRSFRSICWTSLVYRNHRFIIHCKWSHYHVHNYTCSCGPVQLPVLPHPPSRVFYSQKSKHSEYWTWFDLDIVFF